MDSSPGARQLFWDPDYNLSADQIYAAVARKVINDEKTLLLLSYVKQGPRLNETLSTWMPEWNSAFTPDSIIPPSSPASFRASRDLPL